MNLNRMRAAMGAAVVAGVCAIALTACSGGDANAAANKAAGELPDLSAQGLTSFPCGTGDAIGGSFQAPADPYVAECWKGSPAGSFLDIANEVQDEVLSATGGENVTESVCPEDALSSAGGISCRAVLVTEGSSTVVVRTVVVLADPSSVLKGLPENPSQDQVQEAIAGAAVEVLVGTQSPTEASASPVPSAS